MAFRVNKWLLSGEGNELGEHSYSQDQNSENQGNQSYKAERLPVIECKTAYGCEGRGSPEEHEGKTKQDQ